MGEFKLKRRTSGAIITQAEAGAIIEAGRSLPSVLLMGAPTWTEAGTARDPRGRLTTILDFCGANLSVQAIGVHLVRDSDRSETRHSVKSVVASENGVRIEFDCDNPNMVEIGRLWTALGMHGIPETIEIEGRHYAVIARPFSG